MERLFLLFLFLISLMFGAVFFAVQEDISSVDAQDTLLPTDLVLLMRDTNGIRQVYRIPPTGENPQQLTHAGADIETFDVSGSAVAYIIGDTLYLNDEAIQTLNRPQSFSVGVQLSPDGSELTYADETGLYIMDMESRQSELILEQIDFLNPDNVSGVEDGRFYSVGRFIENTPKLMINVGLWEGGTLALYDRETATLTTLDEGWGEPGTDFRLFNRFIRLEDGRVLLHNAEGRGCFPCGLWIAPSFDDILSYEQVVDESALNLSDSNGQTPIPYIHDMVEVSSGVIRILISQFSFAEDGTLESSLMIADVDLSTVTVTLITTMSADNALYQPTFTNNGETLVGIAGVDYNAPNLEGILTVVDVASGQRLSLNDGSIVAAPLKWVD